MTTPQRKETPSKTDTRNNAETKIPTPSNVRQTSDPRQWDQSHSSQRPCKAAAAAFFVPGIGVLDKYRDQTTDSESSEGSKGLVCASVVSKALAQAAVKLFSSQNRFVLRLCLIPATLCLHMG